MLSATQIATNPEKMRARMTAMEAEIRDMEPFWHLLQVLQLPRTSYRQCAYKLLDLTVVRVLYGQSANTTSKRTPHSVWLRLTFRAPV